MSGAVTSASRAKTIANFAAVYLIWGSTYLAIRLAIDTIPPLLMGCLRFVVAGAVLYAWARLRGAPRPTARNWRAAVVVGGLLLAAGNGGVIVAERTVPSGVAALIVAMMPLWMVLLHWLWRGGPRPTGRTVVGLALGLVGIALLVGPGALTGGGLDPFGTGILLVGSFCWAAGSIYSREAALPSNVLLGTAMEMLAGGAILGVVGAVGGEVSAFDPGAVSTTSLLAVAYLIAFGSLVGFTAYIWLLGHVAPARVSTYAYVNPVVAVLLGWLFLHEPLTPRMLAAAAVIVAAVVLITSRGARGASSPADAGRPEAELRGAVRGRVRRLRRRRAA